MCAERKILTKPEKLPILKCDTCTSFTLSISVSILFFRSFCIRCLQHARKLIRPQFDLLCCCFFFCQFSFKLKTYVAYTCTFIADVAATKNAFNSHIIKNYTSFIILRIVCLHSNWTIERDSLRSQLVECVWFMDRVVCNWPLSMITKSTEVMFNHKTNE